MSDVLKKSFSQLALADLVVPSLLTNSQRDGLLWFRHRLQSTEPMEVASRVWDLFRHAALAIGRQTVRPVPVKPRDHAISPVQLPVRSVLEGMSSEDKQQIIAQAAQWVKHEASFFALIDVPLGDRIDWHRDYSSGVIGPKKYSALINHRNSADVGDVKYTWELNRLQHLLPLALASLWTGSDAYSKEIQEQTRSWREQNQFMMGLNWKSPLEAGLRLISWAFVLFLGSKSHQENAFHTEFLETIYQHQYYVSKFYSKHSSANNHLIGEMTGLYVASVFWPYFRESDSWRSLARRKLMEEIVRQVEDDGVGKERATEYQLFVLEFFILAGALGQAIGDPFPETYWGPIQRMAAFLAAIADRNSNMPLFGDGDSGQVIAVAETTRQRVRSLLRVCRLIKQNDTRDDADLRSRLLLWGQKSEELPLPSPREANRELQQFSQGGYYVLASNRGADDEVIVVFDAGPLGLPPLYAHGHADALSFCLSYGGQEFLIDPGTFTYYTREEWREYFRSTAAHNTIRVDGLDQSVPGGRFLWRRVAGCCSEHAENNQEFVNVRAFHDGYRRLPDPVIHRRELRLDKRTRSLLVTDLLECKASHDVEVFFHFSEHCQVRQMAPDSFLAVNNNRRLNIRTDRGLQAQLWRGSEAPISGWVSRKFGVKEPSFTLVGKTRITGSTQLVSEIVPL
jgi:uncharacterized heparinase superfamily protein